MRDPEFDDEVSRCQKGLRPGRWLMRLGLVLTLVPAASILGFPGCSRTPYTCAVCREGKVVHSVLGVTWSDREETDCSRWYQGNVEPSHAHCWTECSHCRRFGIPGLYSGYGCFAGGPITSLSRTIQIDVYQHFKDPLEAKELFIRMGQGDYRELDALMEWADARYPGTWKDWLGKHGPTEEATP